MFTGKNIIGNELMAGGTSVFQAENPSTGQKTETRFTEATADEINLSIEKASGAFKIYRNKSGVEKALFLESIAAEIVAIGDHLIKTCMQETGLPEARLIGERGRTVNQLKLFAELLKEGSWVDARIDLADPERKPLPKPDIRSMLKPLGPVGIFGASNFPLAFSVAGGDTVSALAAGCPVVVKAHQAHPGTSELVGLAIQKAAKETGMPEGTFSMVQGASVEVGLSIVRHPKIKAIGFTGSFRGGKALFDEANKRLEPIPVYAEMGSSNPVFILPQALKQRNEAIAKDLAASVTLGVGQFCTNPGLVFIEELEESKAFKQNLSAHIGEVAAGVMLTFGISGNYRKGVEKLTGLEGIKVLAKGKEQQSGYQGVAHVFETTGQNFIKNPSIEEEVFGPSSLAITVDSKAQLISAAEKLSGHLTATIHGTDEDLKEYRELIHILEQKVGRLIFNGYPTGVEVCHSMVHGGPYPSTTDSRTTSVGTGAILRFSRPVSYQGFPSTMLPDELKDENPLNIWRLVNGERNRKSVP
jgi:2,5-dioxopentanoate dehydrogenase